MIILYVGEKKSIYLFLNNVYCVQNYEDCKKVFEDKTIPKYDNVDKLFEKYSITINDLDRRDATLLNFIIDKALYRLHND